MIMVKEPSCDVSRVQQIITKHVPNAKLESNISAELSFVLPNESSSMFEQLFSSLETNKTDLGISSFGASVTTMEEVFLKYDIMCCWSYSSFQYTVKPLQVKLF